MQVLNSSPTLHHFSPRPKIGFRVSTLVKAFSCSTGTDEIDVGRTSYEGVRLEKKVESGKTRLDAWISSKIVGISRARVQSSIRAGIVTVNGRIVDKVVHPAPGNVRGTLVNAILNHCSLPTVALADTELLCEGEDDFNMDLRLTDRISTEQITSSSIRPGIVHRLDKGTSGLLVVAKDEHSHAHLAEQFKSHKISRVYLSLTSGVPSDTCGRVEVPVGRDLNNRIRMTAVTGKNQSGPVRHAASRYKVLEVLANGGAAVVEWRLETGRTHQIRVHAKYMGIPLLGDELYGGTKDLALSLLRPRIPANCHLQLIHLVSTIDRPCLHAMVLGFKHPCTGKYMHFSCPPPADITGVLSHLRNSAK